VSVLLGSVRFLLACFFAGDYRIEVCHNDIPVEDKPYVARVFDVSKVTVSDFPSSAIVDTATYFISKYLRNGVIRSSLPSSLILFSRRNGLWFGQSGNRRVHQREEYS
jgi:hypothetical protein